MENFAAEIPPPKILSTLNILCQKFAAVCQKIATSCPPSFSIHVAAGTNPHSDFVRFTISVQLLTNKSGTTE